MTDQDLRDSVNRLNLERRYDSLTDKSKTKGVEYVKSALDVAGKTLLVASSASSLGSTRDTAKAKKAGEVLGLTSKIAEESGKISGNLSKNRTKSKPIQLSDQELKRRVERLSLEKDYGKLTSGETPTAGERVRTGLDVVGGTLAITSSALSIALLIRSKKP